MAPSHLPPLAVHTGLLAEVLEIERATGRALARRQDKDGFWRDFQLKPGRAETWSTAWIGWGLAHAPPAPEINWALRAAAQALMRCARPEGWGYNRLTECDADSSAWVTLFLSLVSPTAARNGLPALIAFLDSSGQAHTFSDPRYGTWNDAHAEVTAIAALACLATGVDRALLLRMREALIGSASMSWPPQSFWWGTDAYRATWTLMFLSQSGGVPMAIAGAAQSWLTRQAGEALSDFEHALHLLCLCAIAQWHSDLAAWHACRLAATSSPSGWPGSCVLLVPSRGPGGNNELPRGPHADSGAMTSSLALAALSRWRRAMHSHQVAPPSSWRHDYTFQLNPRGILWNTVFN